MVVLVRTQEAKDRVHPSLAHALILTIYEAKGLEFEEVILYNFFTDSDLPVERWRHLREVDTVANLIARDVFVNYDLRKDPNTILGTSHKPSQKMNSLMCTELKHLYVAITRPK